jgi:Fe-S-cluster containining protein
MDLDTRLKVLEELYRIYKDFAGTLDVACRKPCAACCTDKVVVTTLEGYRMISGLEDDLRSQFFETLHQGLSPTRFKPSLTTNRLAELCMKDEDVPEEEMDSIGGGCAFLVDDACPLYAKRPFACRCMLSTTDCNKTGYAEMDGFVVTVNNVFLQYIEVRV